MSEAKKFKLLAMEFLLSSSSESSSDSSDEDDNLFLKNVAKSKKPKIEGYMNIVTMYTEKEFKRHFRMNRSTFEIIKNKYENSGHYKTVQHGGSPAISPNVAVLSFLWYAGNKCAIRDVAERFGIAESTFHASCTKVLSFLNDLAPSVIKFPITYEEKNVVAGKFEELQGFPNVLGCIDGTYIPIRTPHNKIKSTYVNRHDTPSITLQGICRNDKLFLDVFTGISSKIHDSRVYKLSYISKRLPEICGDEWHIIGDSAYPVRKWLLTPYREYGNLTNRQQNYNRKLSATRVKIENAFGLLKARWRQLIRTDFATVSRTADFVISCCVLHNLCILHNDEWQEQYVEVDDAVVQEGDLGTEIELKRQGEAKRDAICRILP